jgi:tetratricopeptide (TPR) repeat protein
MRGWLVVSLITAALLFVPGVVAAQSVAELNEAGVDAFASGKFEEAAKKFKAAYDLEPTPSVKKNEALAWYKAEKCDDARRAAGEYLTLPDAEELSVKESQTIIIRCDIKSAEAKLAADDLDGATTLISDARTRNPAEADTARLTQLEGQVTARRDQIAAEQAQAQQAVAEAEAAKKREAKKKRDQRMRIIGLSVASTGAAILVGTLVYHLSLATGTSKKFKDAAASGDRATYDKLGKRLETANWLVPVMYSLGAATSGVGGFLWYRAGGLDQLRGAGGQESPRATEAGVMLIWRF